MTTALAIQYEDVHEYEGFHYYIVPNESLTSWKKLLEDADISVDRAAGICSAGEVGLFNLLPHVKRELVLIDHSTRSIAVAAVKHLILQKVGPDKAKELFESGDAAKIRKAFDGVKDKLPPKLQESYEKVFGTKKDLDHLGYAANSHARSLKSMWADAPLKKTCNTLGKVKFLHGDLTDLVERGPFGLLYLSNALDSTHRSRSGQAALAATVEKAVKPGGYVLDAVSAFTKTARSGAKWDLIAEHSPYTNIQFSQWVYRLYQTPK